MLAENLDDDMHQIVDSILCEVEREEFSCDETAKFLIQPALNIKSGISSMDVPLLNNSEIIEQILCEPEPGRISLRVKISALRYLIWLMKRSCYNMWFLSNKTSLFSKCLELLQNEIKDSETTDVLVEILDMLAGYSISVADFKALLRSLLMEKPYVGYCWKKHSTRLLGIVGSLPFKHGPDQFFIFPGVKDSGIILPPMRSIPSQKGFSVAFWFNMEPPNNVLFQDDTPYLYCFQTSKGIGYTCRIIGNCLSVSFHKSDGRVLSYCFPVEINPHEWTFAVIVHRLRRWNQDASVECYINKKLIKTYTAPFRVDTNDVFERCSIGCCAINELEKTKNVFVGQMSLFSMFATSLEYDAVLGLYALGPQHKGGLKFLNEAYHLLSPLQQKMLYDGSLLKLTVFSYSAGCCDGNLILQSAPDIGFPYFVHNRHAHLLQNTVAVQTYSFYRTVHSIGGIKVLFPLLELIQIQEEDGAPNFMLCTMVVDLFCDMIIHSFTVLHQILSCNGFMVIGTYLSKLPSKYFNGKILDSFINVCQHTIRQSLNYKTSVAVRAIHQLIDHILLNQQIWQRSHVQVQRKLYHFLATEVTKIVSKFDTTQRVTIINRILGTLKSSYSAMNCRQSSVDSYEQEIKQEIRTYLMLAVKNLCILPQSIAEEIETIVVSLAVTDDEDATDVLNMIASLLGGNPRYTVPAFQNAGGTRVVMRFLEFKSIATVHNALLVIGMFLRHSTKQRKSEAMGTFNLFALIGEKLANSFMGDVKLQTITILLEIMTDTITVHQFEKNKFTVTANVAIQNPQMNIPISTLLKSCTNRCATELKVYYIGKLCELCKTSKTNRASLLQLSLWQDLYLSFLNVSGKLEPEDITLNNRIYELLQYLMFYVIRNEAGGWRVWIDTCAILHNLVNSQKSETGSEDAVVLHGGDFCYTNVHLHIITDLLEMVEKEIIENLSVSKDIVDSLSNKSCFTFLVNLTHLFSQLGDVSCDGCGGLLSLITSVTASENSPESSNYFDAVSEADFVKLLVRLVNCVDTVMLFNSSAIAEAERELDLDSGVILRQIIRMYMTSSLLSCMQYSFSRYNKSHEDLECRCLKYDSLLDPSDFLLSNLMVSIRDVGRRADVGVIMKAIYKDKFSVLQERDMQRLRNIVYREVLVRNKFKANIIGMEDSKQLKQVALCIVYFISVLMVSRYRDIIEKSAGLSDNIVTEISTTISNGSTKDECDEDNNDETSETSPNKSENSQGLPDSKLPKRKPLENEITKQLHQSFCLISPFMKDVLAEFSFVLENCLVGSRGQDLVNAGLSSMKNSVDTIDIAMLLCSQEWQSSLQKHAGLAFLELVNEGRNLMLNFRAHMGKVAVEASYILERMQADVRAKHIHLNNWTDQVCQQCKTTIEAFEDAMESQHKRDVYIATRIVNRLHQETLSGADNWMVWSDVNKVFYKLDMSEDSNRCRKIMVPNLHGSNHEEASMRLDCETMAVRDCHNQFDDSLKSLLRSAKMNEHSNLALTSNSDEEDDMSNEDQHDNDDMVTSLTIKDDFSQGALKISTQCQTITPMRSTKGTIYVTEDDFVFEIQRDIDGKNNPIDFDHYSSFKWMTKDISMILTRSYVNERDSLELFINNGTTVFFAFANSKVAAKVTVALPLAGAGKRLGLPVSRRTSLASPSQLFRSSDVTQRWQRREISNFDYIMFLNTIAGRSYQDLNQYPVFPWIISNYEDSELDLTNPSSYRDLSKPIGAQNKDRLKMFLNRYNNWSDETIPPFHYGTHYSTASFVLNWLIRLEPFTTYYLDLQNGCFDYGNRLFHSIPNAWKNCQSDSSDVKELIPELFYLPEMLINLNGYNLGKTEDDTVIGDVILPPWASSPDEFIRINRMALESDLVSCQLHQWIDLIFGYKQNGPEAVNATNVFYYLTYPNAVSLESIEDPVMRESIINQIRSFGRTPSQILYEPHPPRGSALTASPTLYRPVEEDICVVLNFTSSSPIVHISAHGTYGEPTHQDISKRMHLTTMSAIVAVSSKYDFSVNPYVQQLRDFSYKDTGGSLPIKPDPSILSKTGIKKSLGYSFDAKLHISCNQFAVSYNNEHIISTGYWDRSIRVISTTTGKIEQVVFGHFDIVTCVAMGKAHKSEFLLTGSRDATVLVWMWNHVKGTIVDKEAPNQAINPSPFAILTGHEAEVVSVHISQTNQGQVISGSYSNGYYKLLQHNLNGELVRVMTRLKCPVQCLVDVSPSGLDDVVIASGDKLLMFTVNGRHLSSSSLSEGIITAMAFDRSGRFLAVGTNHGVVHLYSSFSLKHLRSYPRCDSEIKSLAITWNQRHIAGGLANGRLILLNVNFNNFAQSCL